MENIICYSLSWSNVADFSSDYALNSEKAYKLGLILSQLNNVDGVFVVSSCNRSDIFLSLNHSQPNFVEESIYNFFDKTRFEGKIFEKDDALKYSCRVMSGLESVVIGEHEIRGQYKNAIKISRNEHWISQDLDHLYKVSSKCANDIFNKTTLNKSSTSVVGIGIDKMLEYIEINNEKVEDVSIGIIGAGASVRSFVKSMKNKSVKNFNIYNRTRENIVKLMSSQGITNYKIYESVNDLLQNSKYIFSAVYSDFPMLDNVNGDKYFIDVSVPTILNTANQQASPYCTMKEIELIVNKNIRLRQDSIDDAENIIFDYCS